MSSQVARPLEIEVQPPHETQRGVYLNPPVVATLNGNFDNLVPYTAVARLVDVSTGEIIVSGLQGNYNASANPMPNDNSSKAAYFYFNMAIKNAGTYVINVLLMEMVPPTTPAEMYSNSNCIAQVNTRTIEVVDHRTNNQTEATPDEKQILQIVYDDGFDVPEDQLPPQPEL